MRALILGLLTLLLLAPSTARASEAGDLLRDSLYAGQFETGIAQLAQLPPDDSEAKFGQGVLTFASGMEDLSQALYRYGAVIPDLDLLNLFLSAMASRTEPANPHPEKLTYAIVRDILQTFVTKMDAAKVLLEAGGGSGEYVTLIDSLRIKFDADGDGVVGETEIVGAALGPIFGRSAETGMNPDMNAPAPGGKVKKKSAAPDVLDTTIGFDRADAIWLAGYSQILAAQADYLLAHDFEGLVNAYFHRIFPKAGLPMQEFSSGGVLFLDPESDTGIADLIAAIHNLNFKVIEPQRLARVLGRLKEVTALSRQNWKAILAETDDNRELVPSPTQTSMVPGAEVNAKMVAAWLATLDTADQILDGKLLVPHWRFKQGFDLKAYFETATRTDLVMLLTGQGAQEFLRDGPVADAKSFAEANAIFGDNLWGYAFWFN